MNRVVMIDTHCHLNFESYAGDRPAVLARAAAAGVTRLIIPAVDTTTGAEALGLADAYPGIYVAIGIHPNSTAGFTPADLDALAEQAQHPRVVAVGEIGLDYYWHKSPKADQHAAFTAQLAWAARLQRPVIIHNREASADTLALLAQWVAGLPTSQRDRPGVLHSFSGSLAHAEHALALGFYLGFTGPITFGKADDLRHIAAAVPLDRLLVETDAPFLTPHPHRGQRNEPAYIPYIVERLAAVKGLTPAEVAQATTANAERLFQLPN